MRLIPIVLILAGAVAFAACGGGEPSEPGQPAATDAQEPPAISYDPAPGSVVVDVTQPLGGFVPQEIAVDRRPQFRLHGDGTVIALPAEPALGGFPELETYRLSEEGVQWVLEQADATGLLSSPPDYGQPLVTDVGTVTVTITAGGVQVSHSVYGPGFEDEAAGLTDAQIEARKALAGFVSSIVALPEAQPGLLAGPAGPYPVESLEVWAWELAAEVEGATVEEWPLAEPLGDAPADAQSGPVCFEIGADDAAALEAAIGGGEGLGRIWQSGTTGDGTPRLWSVGLNPILPGDPGCPADTP
jgi:hypothetical protein